MIFIFYPFCLPRRVDTERAREFETCWVCVSGSEIKLKIGNAYSLFYSRLARIDYNHCTRQGRSRFRRGDLLEQELLLYLSLSLSQPLAFDLVP